MRLLVSLIIALAMVPMVPFAEAGSRVHVVEFVNFSCSYSDEFNKDFFAPLKAQLKTIDSELVIAPFSNTKDETGLHDRVFWALKIIGEEHADKARDYFFSAKRSGFPLNSRSSIQSFIADTITDETLDLKGLNYDRLFALAESEIVQARQFKALKLLKNLKPVNLPFFVIVNKDGPVELIERTDGQSIGQLAYEVKARVDHWYAEQQGQSPLPEGSGL